MTLPPALITLRYSSLEHRRLDITGLRSALIRLIDDSPCFRVDQDIRRELYIYGKVLYKMNGPFRRHGHFQMAKRLKKLLDSCFGAEDGQVKTVSVFVREFSSSIRLDEKDSLYCPSREYFHFVLANVRSLASIFVKMARLCVEFCDRMMHMLNFGHFVQVHCILLGIVARVRSDSCRRLRSLKEFVIDFASQGHLANGLQLKCVNPESIDGTDLARTFQNLDDVERVLEEDRSVSSENLSPSSRKQAIDYFESLFNVRLAEQRERRKRMTGKDNKVTGQGIDFRQALGAAKTSIKSGEPPRSEDLDLGVPVNRATGIVQDASSILEECIVKVDHIKTVQAAKDIVNRLESIEGRRFAPAVRSIKKELEDLKKVGGDEHSKVYGKALKRTRFRLKHVLSKISISV